MSLRSYRTFAFLACLSTVWVVLPGCKKDEPVSIDPEEMVLVKAKLAKADTVDGAEDRVVSKCVGCSLRMDGLEEHSVELAGYTLHLCSDQCKQSFQDGAVDAVLSLAIPEIPEIP